MICRPLHCFRCAYCVYDGSVVVCFLLLNDDCDCLCFFLPLAVTSCFDRYLVFAAQDHVPRQLAPERSVAVGPSADVLPVYPHLRVRHGAVRLEKEPAALFKAFGLGFVRREIDAVPADSGRFEICVAVWTLRVERRLHAPVVRNSDRPPRGGIRLARRRIGPHEEPSVGKTLAHRRRRSAKRRQRRKKKQPDCILHFHLNTSARQSAQALRSTRKRPSRTPRRVPGSPRRAFRCIRPRIRSR